MERQSKRNAISLGMRIGLVFLMAIAVMVLTAYYLLSHNFQRFLTDYTVKLVQSMVDLGVEMVESELENGRTEVAAWGGTFDAGAPEGQVARLARNGTDIIRVSYVTYGRTVSSDGRPGHIIERPDIRAAFQGEVAIHGPYFNEEGEYLICYSAPVSRDGEVVGVLSAEKDGYRFCELIKSIRFVDSGESYLINAEGTDIAVSNLAHIDWVDSGYNARRLLQSEQNDTVKSIVELEQKGLDGGRGMGTYFWEDGLVYVVYAPIPSVNWVLLGGLREEELYAMTQSTIIASISNGRILEACIAAFLLLSGLNAFWIFSSMKKNAEINEKLDLIANHDALTGLHNRHFMESSLMEKWRHPVWVTCQAAVFIMDIDNFKAYNDCYGHPKGDDCLRRVSAVFKHSFDSLEGDVIRYGGEEFLAVAFMMEGQAAWEHGQKVCRLVEQERLPDSAGGFVTVSIGVCHVGSTMDTALYDCIKVADEALYQAKQNGKNQAVMMEGGGRPTV